MRAVLWALVMIWAGCASAPAQDLTALARFQPERSEIRVTETAVRLSLGLSQPVPWRVRLLADPPRLVMDFREVDWTGIDALAHDGLPALHAGLFRPGWSRLVAELPGPMVVDSAGMQTDGAATVEVVLRPASAEEFAARAAAPEPPGWALPEPADLPQPVAQGEGPMVVVLDPGHGGIDPGAERDGVNEAGLMLGFARELKELLLRDGGFEVVMTREEDTFVPLEGRISIARAAGAHVFLSLHADALAEGEAVGATVYTLSDEASDAAAATLAERHDRADLLAGVDLTEQDDMVARVLMDIARTETEPRIARLVGALETTIKGAGLKMHRHPHQRAGFSVLKSPDIPSVLLELGFMSSERDLARLRDPAWRAQMAVALRDALKLWGAEDAVLAPLWRQ
ncbi:MAG TPA: N-acetylmuramoyl-L-alanine amidase [Gemmobacter sp.]|nr:MAG: N-acetylmuramoyl-L-alanine amidase [Rhodobacteraceae bacterium GWF1_65_7]HBU13905.1 N-acetylmuramoyl-L-alanine amidase [Gemmobacter sp.]